MGKKMLAALGAALALAAPAAARTIICYGDSLTFGETGASDSGYLPHLARYLEGISQPATLVNRGIPFDNTIDALGRLPSALTASPEADLVLLMIGTNDLTAWRFNPTLIDPATTTQNLDDMVSLIRSAGKSVIIATVPPRLGNDGIDPSNELTVQLNGVIRSVAASRGLRVAEVNANVAQVANEFNYQDSIHPDPNAEPLIAEAFAAAYSNVALSAIDLTGPVPTLIVPRPGLLSAALDARVEITVVEIGNGTDVANALLAIDGEAVTPTVTPAGRSVRFTYRFPEPLAFGQRVRVVFEVGDTAAVPNTSSLDYSFATVAGNGTGGDVDRSGRIDGRDLSIVARAFGASVGDPDYDFAADVDGNGTVGAFDVSLVAAGFGSAP